MLSTTYMNFHEIWALRAALVLHVASYVVWDYACLSLLIRRLVASNVYVEHMGSWTMVVDSLSCFLYKVVTQLYLSWGSYPH